MRTRLLVAVAALSLLASGCAGVPISSTPQVVGPVGGPQSSAPPTTTPQPGADQRSIVKGFLSANASDDARHTAARAFLTPDAKNRWSDTTVTVVQSELIGNFDPGTSTVTVTGRPVGTLSAAGIYTPVLKGDGTGGDQVSFVYGVKQVAGEWRIDTLKNGLVITNDQFAAYHQKLLYFFDLTESRLVPDPRFTALLDAGLLAQWLVTQLVGGPRPELQNAVNTELPAQTDPHGVSVSTGTSTTVVVPGASQLDPATRTHLAAQLANILTQVTGSSPITITDGGRPVDVPAVGGTQFSPADFPLALQAPASGRPLYYVRLGAVVDEDGKALPGGLGTGAFALTSVAVANAGGTDLRIAGTRGPKAVARLLVGSLSRGLSDTGVRGLLSRPTWAPGLDEVWVGDGSLIYRVTGGGAPRAVPVTTTGGKLAGPVSALRFSPEGSRIAMVLSAPDGSAQVWVGAVVRNADEVRVDNLEPISPLGVVIGDVAWNDQLTLFAVGHYARTGDPNVFEIQVDGSRWRSRGRDNLPQEPDSITAALSVPAWVSAGGSVFTQRGSSWSNPGSETTAGSNPVYLE